ncbi:MAG: pyruvate ferredoxin oxidoreductase [Candidatus Aenigmarchaeota archaeon]|nr:pyruvate ferredoxin oxidoreductase [Candidatus Aenigmarchaeota archaeon]
MTKVVLSGSQAVAEAVKLCRPHVVPIYPITPQTPMGERLCEMVFDGELDAELIHVESEHSAMSACIGASATGARTYTATSSQGLALMHEMLFVASGLRLPVVMGVANRSLSAPLNIWNDQQDSMAERDAGWIQLYVESAQEAFDAHIQAFRIAEQLGVPVMVCLDGFLISHTYETLELLDAAKVRQFLPDYKPKVTLDPRKPVTMGSVGAPDTFMEFRKQQDDALAAAPAVIRKANADYAKLSGRSYGDGMVEAVNMKGKRHALLTMGSVTGTARELLKHEDIGIIKVRSFRPFPAGEIAKLCGRLDSVGVLEKDISVGGNGGALFLEVKAALHGTDCKARLSNFIAGLGGRDITLPQMRAILKKIESGFEGIEWVGLK